MIEEIVDRRIFGWVILITLLIIIGSTNWSSLLENISANRVIRVYLVCTETTRIVEDAKETPSGWRTDKIYVVQYYFPTDNHGMWHDYHRTENANEAFDACHSPNIPRKPSWRSFRRF